MRRFVCFCSKLIFWGVVVVGLAAAGALLLITQHLDEAVRAEVQRVFAEHYQGLHVSVRSAQRVEGQGLFVRGLSIKDPNLEGPQSELLYVDEVFLSSTSAIDELVLGELQVDHIVLRRVALRSVRNEDGTWSTQRLLPLPTMGGKPAATSIEDGTLEVFDPSQSPPSTLTLRRINVALEPAAPTPQTAPGALRIAGSLAGDVFSETKLSGQVNPATGEWSIQGNMASLLIGSQTWQSLPGPLSQHAESLGSLQGKADIAFDLRHAKSGDLSDCQFDLRGNLTDGRYEDERLPVPLREINASFQISNNLLVVHDLTAKGGNSSLHLTVRRDGWNDASPLHITAKARRFHVDDAVADVLPDELASVWETYRPQGMLDADVVLHFDGQTWRPELTVHCLDMSFQHSAFPYQISGTTGSITLNSSVLEFNVSSLASNKPLNMKGRFEDVFGTPFGWMTYDCQGPIPIDARLLAAMDTENLRPSRDLFMAMKARGGVSSHGRFDLVALPSGATQLNEHLFFKLADCGVSWDAFPYPIYEISGEIELWNGQYTFRNVRGHNDSAEIVCNGTYQDDGKQPLLTLNYACRDLPLEEELRRAFPPNMQEVWSSLRPQGTIDQLNLQLLYHPVTDKIELGIVAVKWPQQHNREGQPISLLPEAFPYRLNDVQGEIRYRDGQVAFESLSAVHNNARVNVSGFCQFGEDGSWRLQFSELNTEGLTIDRDLISALPEDLAASIAPMNIQGPLTVTGGIDFRQGPHPQAKVSSEWDLSFDLENGQAHCGIRFSNIHGGVRLVGANNSQGFYSRGEIDLDSIMYQGFQFTRVTGPVWIDRERVAFGAWADQPQPGQQPRRLQALVLGGTLAGDVHISLEDEKYFTLQAQLNKANLAQYAREHLAQQRSVTGTASGMLRLSGTSSGADTLRGDGQLWLRQANIYELPVMVALLKILKIKPLDNTAFTSSDVEFRVNGEDIYLDRIVFDGDAISLKGAGEVNLDRQVNLQFYTLVGKDSRRIPIIWPLMAGASRRILMIEVTGSLDNPVTTRNVLPGLNSTIERLFSPEELGSSDGQNRGRAANGQVRYQR